MAAAVAGELRIRAAAPAALVTVWRGESPVEARRDDADVSSEATTEAAHGVYSGLEDGQGVTLRDLVTPAGAATAGARRLAARLVAHGFAASARGRIAWLALPVVPEHAVAALARARAVVDGPVVLGVAGPRPPELEPALADQDVLVTVLGENADADLRRLALAGGKGRVSVALAPITPGPQRWAALAGLARCRAVPDLSRP